MEIRRAIIYKRFYNTLPYPEEVIKIDRSKIGPGASINDIVMESYTDYQFKQETLKLFAIGVLQKRSLLTFDQHVAFEQGMNLKVLNEIFLAKSMRDFNMLHKTIELGMNSSSVKKRERTQIGELRLSELTDLI